jgi:TetR/AcrR family transcriptional repressor of nem operon
MSNDTAQRILDSAQALMIERGYNAFSYADIAEEVKVTKASIHFHYATKAVLVQQVLQRYRSGAMDKLWQLSGQIPVAADRLLAYAGHWEHCIRSNAAPICLSAVLASEMPTLPDPVKSEVQAFFAGMHGWLASTLDDGVRDGALHLARDAALEAKALLSVMHGAMLAARVFGDADAFRAVVGDAIARLGMPAR